MIISIMHPIEHNGAANIFFYFTVYSFFGWLLENSYSFFTKTGFFKPNFLKGPFKPMYGFAPVLLLFFINKNTTWPVLMVLCFFIPALIEYVSGLMLQKLFHRQYWDYSNLPLQLHGHICLPFCLCWAVLSLLCIKLIHPKITAIFQAVEPYWTWIFPVVILYFIIELFIAIWKHALQRLPSEERTNTI